MTTPSAVRRLLFLAAGLVLCQGSANAAGIYLAEQDASGAGNAYAGAAAAADDAGTIFYNPAGMTRIKGTQVIVAGQWINYAINFHNTGSKDAFGAPMSGTDGGNAGANIVYPNVYVQTQLGEKFRAGIGLEVPYGLITSYQNGWKGRYGAQTSDITDININPAVAYQVNDKLSVGAGFNAARMHAKLTNAIDEFATCVAIEESQGKSAAVSVATCHALGFNDQANDGGAQLTGDSWGYGYNAGVLYQVTEKLRAGLSYRSQQKFLIKGSASFQPDATWNAGPLPGATGLFQFTQAHAGIVTPDMWNLGVYHQCTDKLGTMANVTWTGWSVFDHLVVHYDNVHQPTTTLPLHWQDTITAALGATYRADDYWTLRGGVGYEQTPVRTTEQAPRIPDTNRIRLSVGGGYKIDAHNAIDIAYSHLFTDLSQINFKDGNSGASQVGNYVTNANLISVQYKYSF